MQARQPCCALCSPEPDLSPDTCWQDDDKRGCVENAYQLRIAELQAKYRLVAASESVAYACDGDPRNEVVVTFFRKWCGALITEFRVRWVIVLALETLHTSLPRLQSLKSTRLPCSLK
jgi:hypothetical protein